MSWVYLPGKGASLVPVTAECQLRAFVVFPLDRVRDASPTTHDASS